MKFWTDKQGNRLTFKEFMKRWMEGIEGITPLQQAKTNLYGTWLIITGVIWGLVVVTMIKTYWMSLILFGAFITTVFQLLNTWQKAKRFKKIEKANNEAMGIKEPDPKKERKKNYLLRFSMLISWIVFFTGVILERNWIVALSYVGTLIFILIKVRQKQ